MPQKKQFVTFRGQRLLLERLAYKNGRVALALVVASGRDKGEPYATATVNIPEVPLADNEAIVKDYSENAGMLEALIEAGIVEDTGRFVQSGFVQAPIVRVLS